MRVVVCRTILIGLLLPGSAFGQMTTGPGTAIVLDAGTTVRLNIPAVWQIPSGAIVVNNGSIVLGPQTSLLEASGAAISGSGTEQILLDLASPPTALDAGGLGGIITTSSAPGNTSFTRGHVPYTDFSGHTSIARWMHVVPAANTGLNATFSLRYDQAELNAVPEASQILHIRAQDDIWWMLPTSVNTGERTVTTSGLDSLGLFTTFDQDLPNAIQSTTPGMFVVGMSADGHPWLQIPLQERVTTMELFDTAGRLLARSATMLGSGWHPVTLAPLVPGLYLLRLNGTNTYTLAWP